MKKAFLVAINRYRNPRNNLRGCINDMMSFHEVLKKVYSMKDSNVKAISDYTATFDNILKGFTQLLKETNPGETAIFYFSGHGTQVIDISGDEIRDGMDECICPHDLSWIRPFTDDILSNAINQHLKRDAKLWMIFDCCHSGTLSRNIDDLYGLDYSDYDDVEDIIPRHHSLDDYERARYINPPVEVLIKSTEPECQLKSFKKGISTDKMHGVISAAQSYEKALEMRIDGKPRGIFTTTLVDILKQNPQIDAMTLKQMMYANIKNYTHKQNPHIEVPSNYGNIFS